MLENVLDIGEEVIGGENLEALVKNKPEVIAYDGFEPSGRMHIAQGLLRAHNTNLFVDNGIKFKFWVADWFALMNLKLGGDLKKINLAGELMIHTWKACGMKLDKTNEKGEKMIEFIKSSEEINKRSDEYWRLVLDIATKFNLNRVKRCTQIMGRKNNDVGEKLVELKTMVNEINDNNILKEKLNKQIDDIIKTNQNDLATSQIFYPIMQCADIFFLKCDICSLGMDQKKVNMLALEYCNKIKRKFKPIIISHHMVMGLDGSDKMSKSNPDNTIFMDDSEIEVNRKIKKAFCEPNNIEKNPILDWIKWIIFPIKREFKIPKNKFNSEEQIYNNYFLLENDFKEGKIHPSDIKLGLQNIINELLSPVRNYFKENKEANELLKKVKKFKK